MFLDFVDSSEKSLRPETFFFFIGCISYALRDARKEDNGVGVRGFDSHPRLFFSKYGWCKAGRLA